MVVGLVTVYGNLVEFSGRKIKDENRSELIIVGNAISKLYEIENSQNLYSAEMAAKYFSKYDSILPSVEQNLDSLKTLSSDTLRIHALDSISTLLLEKNRNLKEIAVLLDSINKLPLIEKKILSSFVPKKLNNDIADYLGSKNINQVALSNDTTIVKGQRKGFFSRIRDAVIGKEDSTILVEKQPVMKETEMKLVADTIINMVQYSERLNFNRQKKFQQILYQRQSKMTHTNDMLSSRIDYLLNEIEKEEYNKYVKLLENRSTMLVSSQRIIYMASLLAALIAIAFAVVSLVNINRNFRYRRKLEESNARISDLLESRQKHMLTISHDIKAPMSSILGYTELMEGSISPQKKVMYIENMRKSGEHILQLVGNLLNYHKLESGTWNFKEINFNVHDLVEVTAKSFEPAALRKKLAFSVENQIPEVFSGFGDAYVIRQVMSNILSNAIKYTPSGSVRVKASLTGRDTVYHLHFSVKDTGLGIDEEEQKIIFQEFRQLEPGNPDLFEEGSGLGLAITHGLVKELHGELSLQSEKGKGSEFSVSLPIVQGDKTPPPRNSALKTNYNFNGLCVLVVDDDPIQLTMASEMLKLKGVQVVTETNPENVQGVLKNHKFDIIFVDIQMPNISGLRLSEMIRNSDIDYCRHVPIIILSAKQQSEKTDAKISYTDYLSKPFTSNSLYGIIDKYVKAAPGNSFAEASADGEKGKGIKQLINFVKDDKQASHDILDSFVTETSANVNQLQNAFDNGNVEEAASFAHKMLPLFQMIEDGHVASTLQALEKKEAVEKKAFEKTVSRIHNHLWEAQQLKTRLSAH